MTRLWSLKNKVVYLCGGIDTQFLLNLYGVCHLLQNVYIFGILRKRPIKGLFFLEPIFDNDILIYKMIVRSRSHFDLVHPGYFQDTRRRMLR